MRHRPVDGGVQLGILPLTDRPLYGAAAALTDRAASWA